MNTTGYLLRCATTSQEPYPEQRAPETAHPTTRTTPGRQRDKHVPTRRPGIKHSVLLLQASAAGAQNASKNKSRNVDKGEGDDGSEDALPSVLHEPLLRRLRSMSHSHLEHLCPKRLIGPPNPLRNLWRRSAYSVWRLGSRTPRSNLVSAPYPLPTTNGSRNPNRVPFPER